MGEVWRARDTRLGREVAIKILPAEFAHDPKLKIRFEREAKTISQLSHPNICALFDVGENYIVMELLDGESLARRIARGRLPINHVIRYGMEIAEALSEAHREGIVHRDVKPGNVMLTKSGAKLLDFGIAKSVSSVPGDDTATDQMLTAEGQIVGTFQYMAPEQIAGEEPDERSDIFALGAVLYEMATGNRAFEGNNRADLASAITSGEPPPIRQLQPTLPPALEHLILNCLEKAANDRWQNAADIAAELRWISESGSKAAGAAPVLVKRRRREWIVGAIALLFAAAVAQAWFLFRRAPAEQTLIESSIGMEPTGGFSEFAGAPAFSPDGKTLAFAADDKNGRRMLWVRSLAGASPQPLANTDGAMAPFWSADGKFIAFCAGGKLKKLPAGGGISEVIADARTLNGGGGTWNRDGVILYKANALSALLRVTPGGQPAEVLTAQALGAVMLAWPWFLPDGNHFLVEATGTSAGAGKRNRQPDGVWLATLDGTEQPRFLTPADSSAIYVEPGWLLFIREGVLRAQRFDRKTLRLSGDPTVIAPVQWNPVSRYAPVTASNSGCLVYQKPVPFQLSELQLRNRSGELVKALGRGEFYFPSLSDDGRRVAVDRSPDVRGDIWVLELENGSEARLTFDPRNDTMPVWSPDNQTIAYRATSADGRRSIAAKRIGGQAETLLDVPGTDAPTDWSRDGRYIAFNRHTSGIDDVLVLSLLTHATIDVATTPAVEVAAVFSPDTKWIAYQSDETGRSEVYVQPFPPTGAKYQITSAGGHWPRWRVADTIEYVDENGHFSAVHVKTTNGVSADPPQTFPLIVDDRGSLRFPNFDVGRDGTVLVNSIVHDNPPPLTLVVNWLQRLQ